MHPWLGAWIPFLVLLHVLSAFAFVLLHGPSIAAMWRLRTERELARVQALLDMSRAWGAYAWAGITTLGVTGLLLAAVEHTWREPWVWGSIVVLVVVAGSMPPLAAQPLNEARHAAGVAWFDGRRMQPGGAPQPEALRQALAVVRARAPVVMAIGVVGLAVLVWLMVARPG